MGVNHLLTGMILQAMGKVWYLDFLWVMIVSRQFIATKTEPAEWSPQKVVNCKGILTKMAFR